MFAARPSPLIVGTISTVVFARMSSVRGSSANASSRARIMQASRDDGSLPCTLQLTRADVEPATALTFLGGVGYPMMNMLIGRFRIVRPISTTRTRSLAASSAAV